MKDISKVLSKYPAVEVQWVDAADDTDIELVSIKDTKTYFVKRVSLGRLVKEDEDGVVIITDMDETNKCEITAVPNNFKPTVRYLKNDKKVQA